MSISSFFILDQKGRKLISRCFNNTIKEDIHEVFQNKIINSDELSYEPIIFDEENQITFCYINHNDIILLIATKENENVILIFEFFEKFIEILESYIMEIAEESIKYNFILIYEILEEIIDDGLIQNCDINLLKEYIKSDYKELIKNNPKLALPEMISSNIPWRKEGIYYKKNNCYVDIIETFNFMLNSNGNIIKNEVIGKIMLTSNLSGMPAAELSLNEKNIMSKNNAYSQFLVEFEDINFHHCVDMKKFEEESKIIFIPPDGKFNLMSYIYKSNVF